MFAVSKMQRTGGAFLGLHSQIKSTYQQRLSTGKSCWMLVSKYRMAVLKREHFLTSTKMPVISVDIYACSRIASTIV